MPPAEGVIRFRFEHRHEPLPGELAPLAAELGGWRRELVVRGVLGRDPGRYDGAGFGNLSARVTKSAGPPGRRRFLISGSQTGGWVDLDLAGFALVESWEAATHRLASRGLVEPSSEALTHAALYDASSAVGAVLHVHAPRLWARRGTADLPETDPVVDYGSAEMAAAVAELAGRLLAGAATGLIAMGGHPDGILAFGPDPPATARILLSALDRAD